MSVVATVAAPTGGWNARDSLSQMPPDHAVRMDNWFPGTRDVRTRNGYVEHAKGMPGGVESLLIYSPSSGVQELYAASGGAIYDVTSSGAVGSPVVSGLSNDRWQFTQISGASNHYLFAMNGADNPLSYDGTTWSTMAIPSTSIWCNVHQRRLWFGSSGSLVASYLGTNAVSGTVSDYSLKALASLGGYIMAMGTWTRDTGSGPDDAAVFITSEGEAIVYVGTDPGNAAKWHLDGVFRIGRPIGRRCFVKWGGDLIIITEDGFVTANQVLNGRGRSRNSAISDQVNGAVNESVLTQGSSFGWQPVVYPKGPMLIFNVPVSSTKFQQYVFNTITGAPARFKGMNALCWAMLEGEPYFGTLDGRVMQFGLGSSDDGVAIETDLAQAFLDFKEPKTKAFKLVDPVMTGATPPLAEVLLNIDYIISPVTGSSQQGQTQAGQWGIGLWGIATWGNTNQVFRGWRGVRGIGKQASIRIVINTNISTIGLLSTNFLYEIGGMR